MPRSRLAQKMREAEIAIRRPPWPRAMFIAGVAGAALIGFAAGLFAL